MAEERWVERWKGGRRNGMVERWGEGTKGGRGMRRNEGRDRIKS